MPVLDIVPTVFHDAASRLGENLPMQLQLCWHSLVYDLEDCPAMAGTDEAGAAWGSSYFDAATSANLATVTVLNSCSRLGALLDQTGLNYTHAETASVTGGAHPPRAPARFRDDWCAGLDDVPAAVDPGTPPPDGWAPLAHLIQKAWPDGHQDRLHTAAQAWRRAEQHVRATIDDVALAYHEVIAQNVPESDAAATVLDSIGDQLAALAQGYHAIAGACDDYAHHLDQAHHAIIGELRSFLIWTAGLEAAGGLFAVFTLGISEAVAQGSEAYAMVRFATTIRRLIEILVAATRTTSIATSAAAARIELVTVRLRPILAKHLEEVRIAMAGDRGAINLGDLVPAKLAARIETATPTTKALTELEGANPIAFDSNSAASAFAGMRGNGGHAIRHLRAEGLIAQTGTLDSQVQEFTAVTTPILTNPTRTFPWRLGATSTRAFAGKVSGRDVVVFVATEGSYSGRVLSAVVPNAAKAATWGLT